VSEQLPGDGQYHIDAGPGDVAESVLLPGNPERVDTVVDGWDEYEQVAHHREYRTATGSYEGTPISVTSTGIGAPSTGIAVEELARVGADTFIRIGSCGAVQPKIEVGDLVISTGAVRQEGTSDEYVRADYPASASYEVVAALVAAAERLGYDYHVGPTMSADSFYTGQGREGFEGYHPPGTENILEELQQAGVKNIEMESAALFSIAGIYGLRAGTVCTVYADRSGDTFAVEGERRATECGSLAVHLLVGMADARREAGADRWYPGLGTGGR
jgi:uridine phosphorylase